MERGKLRMSGYVSALILSLTISICVIEAGQQNPASLGTQTDDIALVASSRELAAFSAGSLRKDPELGLLIALEAVRKSRTVEAEEALRNALVESRVRTVFRTPAPAYVMDADMSPDGKTIVTAEYQYSEKTRTQTNTFRWWDAATGRESRSISLPGKTLPNIAFCPDGRRVIVSQHGEIRLFDAATGKQLQEFSGGGPITPDGKYFIVHQNSVVQVWDAVTGRQEFQFQSEYQPFLFNPKSGLMVLSGPGQTFHVWDVQAGKYVAEFHGNRDMIGSAAFSPDGTLLATSARCFWGEYDPTVQVWNAKTGSSVAVLREQPGCVDKVLFSPDGLVLLTVGEDGIGRTWNTKTWQGISTLFGNAGMVWSAAFSADSRFIVAGGGDNRPRIWEAATGKIVAELCGHEGHIRKTLFTSNGNQVLTAADDGTVRLWDVHAGLGSLELGLGAPTNGSAFSQDGTRVITNGQAATALVWETRTGTLLLRLGPHGSSVTHAEFSRDGRFILTSSLDGSARFWEATTGKLISEMEGGGKFGDARLSPDGRRVVTRDGGTSAKVWNTTTGSRRADLDLDPDYVGEVAFSPDGRYIITTCINCGTTWIWDADTGKKVAELPGHRGGTSFSPDSKYLAGNGADGTVCVWSVVTGSIAATLRSSSNAAKSAAFAPDGKHIVACPVDGGICTVWESGSWREVAGFSGEAEFDHANLFSPDGRFVVVYNGDVAAMIEIASGKTISQLSRQRSTINRAAFSPDGRYVATFNQDGTTVVYPWEMFAPLDDLLALAPKRVTRTLSCEERRLYLHGPPCPARTP